MLSSVWDARPAQGFFTLTLADGTSLLIETPSFMAILNATPDSFTDATIPLASKIQSTLEAAQAGVRFIDVGGESTRPGATPVAEQEEMDRVIPVIQSIKKWITSQQSSALISIDTTKVSVAKAAILAGAHLINDVSAGDASNLDMIGFAAAQQIPLILNHSWGSPQLHYKHDIRSTNVSQDIRMQLQKKVDLYTQQGGSLEGILLDPGIGFGKDFQQNMHLITHIQEIGFSQRPLVIGISNKRVVRDLLDRPLVQDRLGGSLGLQLASICNGASIIRTHNSILMLDLCKSFISGLAPR